MENKDLLKAFDSYNDFERKSYFTLMYNCLASELLLEVPMKPSKEHMETSVELIGLNKPEFQVIFKNWKTEDSSNTELGSDYPNQILFKHISDKKTVWVSLLEETLFVEFLYDCTVKKTEDWVINANHKLRQSYGLNKTPTFKVLSRNKGDFVTNEVRFDDIGIDIDSNYNDDFKDVDINIQRSFETLGSGLILFYGVPGTGKTSYIKNLIAKHPDSNFIFVQNEFIKNLLEPDFISFLLKQRNSILIIEDAEKVLTTRTHLKDDSFVSTILQLTDGLFSDYLNIKIICTFNISLSKIDSALLRKGRMIAKYEFKPLAKNKTKLLLNKLGIEDSNDELTISEIFNYNKPDYKEVIPKKIGF